MFKSKIGLGIPETPRDVAVLRARDSANKNCSVVRDALTVAGNGS